MRYVSIDLETTGLDPEINQVIEFGAVIEDTLHMEIPVEELPTFHTFIVHKVYHCNPYAAAINQRVFQAIADKHPDCITERQLEGGFRAFLRKNGFEPAPSTQKFIIIAAGKNFRSFDYPFLTKIYGFKPNMRPLFVQFHRRTIDPMMYFLRPNDDMPPSTDMCLDRAGYPSDLNHDAVEDAQNVIRLVRHGLAIWRA